VTASDLAYFVRQRARMAGMQPNMVAALVKAFANIRENLSERELAELVRTGAMDQLLTAVFSDEVLDRAFLPVSTQLMTTVQRAFQQTIPDLPKGGMVDGVMAVMFGHLNPVVIDAIRALDTKVIESLKADVRDAVRYYVQAGLKEGASVSSIASALRDYIGLGPTQVQETLNFRDALLGQNGRSMTDYTLRNRTVDRLIKNNGALTPAQVDKYTAAYRDARIAQNTKTVAGTAMKDAYKLGHQTTWENARDAGVVPDGFEIMKTWVGVMDDRERDEHIEMEGETVPMDDTYSNGNDTPGDDTYNCRCISRFSIERTDDVLAMG
jgi:hypothetical protein